MKEVHVRVSLQPDVSTGFLPVASMIKEAKASKPTRATRQELLAWLRCFTSLARIYNVKISPHLGLYNGLLATSCRVLARSFVEDYCPDMTGQHTLLSMLA